MKVKFGVWYDFRNPEQWRRPWRQLYEETLEQVAWADTLGFDSAWLSEHHFTDDGYLPSLFAILAAFATRTNRLRLGTAVLLTPLHHPLRLAEDAAVVDLLSGGRLDLGLALGYRVEEFANMGIPRHERGSRTDETIEILKAAWSGQRFSYRGRYFQFENTIVTPPPLQRPYPPLWVGGSSAASARRAGRFGCHFLPGSQGTSELYQVYRDALDAHGYNPEDFEITTNLAVYVCEDPEQGWDEVKAHYLYAYNRYREWFAAAGDSSHGFPP